MKGLATMKNNYILFITIIMIIANCDNKTVAPDNEKATNIYLAGFYDLSASGQPYACFWKNDILTAQITRNSCSANSIFISNGNIHITGSWFWNELQVAYYWHENSGTFHDLRVTNYKTVGKSIFVYGKDVYIAGYYQLDKHSNRQACYWLNENIVYLSPSGESYANSIYVHNNDIYVAGGYENRACYWKNSTRIDLQNNAGINSIVATNNYVYAAGFFTNEESRISCYWIDGVKTDLSSSGYSEANSIFIQNGNVYIAGYTAIGDTVTACFWKNDVRTDLYSSNIWGESSWYAGEISTLPATANSIFVFDDDIYIAGRYRTENGEFACYWKNGNRTNLYNAFYAGANSIYVVSE